MNDTCVGVNHNTIEGVVNDLFGTTQGSHK